MQVKSSFISRFSKEFHCCFQCYSNTTDKTVITSGDLLIIFLNGLDTMDAMLQQTGQLVETLIRTRSFWLLVEYFFCNMNNFLCFSQERILVTFPGRVE